MESIAHSLAKYSVSLDFSHLSPEAVHEVKRRILDSLACAFGAYNSHPGLAAREIGKRVITSEGSTLIGTEKMTSPELATFTNGILIRYLDYNDTYLSKEPAHPSDNISAAFAVAESEGASGKALITAIVLAYEIQCRLCDQASLRANGWDHVTYVSISSALLSSKLMGLDDEKTAHALALAITPNITLRQTRVGELSMWKGCAAANAARNGVFAALLAREGMTGPSPIFEGEKGFFHQVTGPFDLNPDTFGGKSGSFKILDTYIKNFPSEYHSQAAVEAALELKKEVQVKDIEKISIQTYDACVDIIAGDVEKWRPETRETADHSLPYIVAVALIDGTVGLEQFSEERIRDRNLQNLIQKVSVARNSEHTALYPKSFPCNIDIKTKTGKVFSKTVNWPKGHPRNPLTDQEVEDKFVSLSLEYLSEDRRIEILSAVWNLDNRLELRSFMKLLAFQ
jgi:2-methylcitrate dehydratase